MSQPTKNKGVGQGVRHGFRRTRFYSIYTVAKARCQNPNARSYEDYGGRGIEFRFGDFFEFRDALLESYLSHCAEHGEAQTTIDRIDNEGHYEASNVRWATRAEQNNNRRPRRWHRRPEYNPKDAGLRHGQ